MMRIFLRVSALALTVLAICLRPCLGQQGASPAPATVEGDFVAKNFKFRSGESLAEVRLHYTTLGKPARDAQSRATNAVLILHGTGGTGHQFLQPIFAGELLAQANFSTRRATTLFFPTALDTGSRRSRATDCTRTSRNTTTTTWCWGTTACSPKASA